MAKLIFALVLGTGVVLAGAATAQRYEALPADSDRAQALIDELRPLIDDAERSRAAVPQFLRDLRSVLRHYDYPWRNRLVTEDFRDGDFTRNPRWVVAAGEFYMARGGGLVSEATGAPAPRQDSGGDTSQRDVVVGIIGLILNEALDDGDDNGGGQSQAQTGPARVGEIYLPVRVASAFAVNAEITAAEPRDRFDLSVYQGSDRRIRYRLSLVPGAGVELLRETARGTAIIDSRRDQSVLTANKTYLVTWQRSGDGVMTVEIDGQAMLEISDRAFRDNFDGVALTNRGGAYVLRTLTIDGAP